MSSSACSRARGGRVFESKFPVGFLVFAIFLVNLGSAECREIGVKSSILALPIDDGDEPADTVVVKAVEIPEEKVSYEGAQLWRVVPDPDHVEFVSFLQETGEISMWSGNDAAVDVLVLPERIPRVSRFLRERRVKYDVVIPDLQQAIDQENPLPSPELMEELEGRKARYAWWQGVVIKPDRKRFHRLRSRLRPARYPVASGGSETWRFRGHRMEWSSYHRLEDIHGYLDYLEQTFPDLCSVVSIGKSFEGRPLKVLRISKGEPGVPAIWIDGGIHAREWISPAAVTYIINHLVENSEQLEADYYILPVVNPDGYEYTFRGDRLWRKNRSSPENGGVCIGVDLNRNFGYCWGGLGTSNRTCREIYAGTGPFSEPETNAIKNFFEASAADFKAFLSFHSYGQFILYPWGYNRRVPADYADLEKVGQQAAAAMKIAGGASSVYTVGNSANTLYPAAGGSDDWAKARLKIKYSYTIELRDRGKHGFILPAQYIVPTAKEALAAVEVFTRASKRLM
ncbi:carboxypeptidase B-like isoform X1 [Venturia canescens]|uniref:carboxypeptidase B-like isoform X1 n=1 Tax=Venturia canescens TaxID=32260 RepID=UPI001C9C1ADD|nr:carboxypeptidase B-like isoform X1 [Venturia canescens]